MAAMRSRSSDEQGRPVAAGRSRMPKIRMYYITADERTNTVLVTGPADKIAQAKEIMKKIDVPQPGQKPIVVGAAGAEDVTRCRPAPRADVATTLQDIYGTSNTCG